MMDMCHAAEALTGRDAGFKRYIKRFSDTHIAEQEAKSIFDAVLTGKKKSIAAMVDSEIASGASPESIINEMIIPALQKVGDLYEQKVYFLPHLIYSAEAARAAFDRLEQNYITGTKEGRKKVVIATVKGDIHDIGKNLVAMLLRNHGFAVTDLGKDVPAENIIDTAQQQDADIIGLSALITTTAKEMETVIALAKEKSVRAKDNGGRRGSNREIREEHRGRRLRRGRGGSGKGSGTIDRKIYRLGRNMHFEVDTHTHTVLSGHAHSTIMENAAAAARMGLKGIVMSDHGPSIQSSAPDYNIGTYAYLPYILKA